MFGQVSDRVFYSFSLPFLITMPPTRSSKRKKRVAEEVVEEKPGLIPPETPDLPNLPEEPQPKAETVKAESPEKMVVDEDVTEAETDTIKTDSSNGMVVEEDHAEAEQASEPKLTMEERKAKLQQLRQKLVRGIENHIQKLLPTLL